MRVKIAEDEEVIIPLKVNTEKPVEQIEEEKEPEVIIGEDSQDVSSLDQEYFEIVELPISSGTEESAVNLFDPEKLDQGLTLSEDH